MRPPFLIARSTLLLLCASLLASSRLLATNPQLAASSSAFLRSYADTAVDWRPWSADTFKRAHDEKKPVFLAIGTFTSEFSRAMARQSFANGEVAAFLNANFVSVVIDADERPDLVALYEAWLGTAKQLNGLPINVWLTPELTPIDGATYLPPTEEWGKEGFFTAIKRIAAAWQADPEAQRRKAADSVAAVKAAQEQKSAPADAGLPAKVRALLADTRQGIGGTFDADHGGFGDPPRYPEPELLQFLLGDPAGRDMALTTLRAIVNGALRDPLDGGFFRYAQDAEWRQPYLQKTLADQARLALALLDAASITNDPGFAESARRALAYALDRLHDATHGFAAAEDATPEKLTRYYFWTKKEIDDVLGADSADFCRNFGVTAEGNVPVDAYPGLKTGGENLLFRAVPANAAGGQPLAAAAKLLARRAQRPAPRRDGTAPAGMHGLILAALARAGTQLHDARFADAAAAELAFIRTHLLSADGALRRLPDQDFAAAPSDYVYVLQGLWSLRDEVADADLAAALQKHLNDTLLDGGRYFAYAPSDDPGIWARVHASADSVLHLPSPEAAMLAASSTHPLPADTAAAIAAHLYTELNDSAGTPQGGTLLALESFAPAK
ncbi:MAG TPA: DUF255 domain-containing protein [Opitutus sp.]|nr:DUF255 domain-containing protein [Opitutus sp.]